MRKVRVNNEYTGNLLKLADNGYVYIEKPDGSICYVNIRISSLRFVEPPEQPENVNRALAVLERHHSQLRLNSMTYHEIKAALEEI